MTKFPLITAKELIKKITKLGFVLQRQKGSHMFFRHPDSRITLIPNHPGENIDRGLLLKIIKQDLHLTKDEFLNT